MIIITIDTTDKDILAEIPIETIDTDKDQAVRIIDIIHIIIIKLTEEFIKKRTK